MSDKLISVGVIAGAYHLKGLVKVNSFTSQPENICKLPCINSDRLAIFMKFVKKDKDKSIICKIDGVEDRTAAEKLVGTKLYVERASLPEIDESEHYIEDLIGLSVIDHQGVEMGKVKALHNFGAGDIIEIEFPNKKTEIYSFSKENFPEITKEYVRFTAQL